MDMTRDDAEVKAKFFPKLARALARAPFAVRSVLEPHPVMHRVTMFAPTTR